ncbi:MAG: alpha/beta fold hydrolase [Alphaproteobacteria bacterium]
MATRGYVVLQPQFRGSAGFGRAWADAGRRQWGGLMQNDLTDGVRDLVRLGAVDPKRVCIVGASYGGYAALAGATLTPELYACAVSVGGIGDLPMMLRWIKARQADQGNPGRLNYWLDHIGPAGDPAVARASPVNNIIAVRAPILLIHGRDDTVVPYAQSAEMAEALKRAGKSATLTPLVGEDHWLSLSQTRTQTLEAMESFLAMSLKPQ